MVSGRFGNGSPRIISFNLNSAPEARVKLLMEIAYENYNDMRISSFNGRAPGRREALAVGDRNGS